MKKAKVTMTEFNEAKRELEDAIYEAYGHEIHVEIRDMEYDMPVTVSVSWASLGSQTAEETAAFAAKLVQAAEMAERFPYKGYKIGNWGAEYWDDMYYYTEEEDDDEQEASCEDGTDAMDETYIDEGVRDEWSRSGSYAALIVEISRSRGDGFMDKIDPIDELEDLDGYGTARAFADELGAEYDEEPGRIDINIALNRIYDICRDYDAIRYGEETALSKYGMAQAWARAIDAELVEDNFEFSKQPSWMDRMEYAEGQLAGWDVTVIYVTENEEDQ